MPDLAAALRRVPLGGAILALALLAAGFLALALAAPRSSRGGAEPVVQHVDDPAKPAVIVNHASWVYRASSLDDLVQHSRAAFEAKVVAITAGPPLLTEPDLETGENVPPIPTQRIHLAVQRNWFGNPGAEVTLFKTGSDKEYIEDDPFYAVGEEYVIFLGDERGDGSFLPAGPDGRLKAIRGKLKPVADGPVGQRLAGASVEQARQAALAARNGG